MVQSVRRGHLQSALSPRAGQLGGQCHSALPTVHALAQALTAAVKALRREVELLQSQEVVHRKARPAPLRPYVHTNTHIYRSFLQIFDRYKDEADAADAEVEKAIAQRAKLQSSYNSMGDEARSLRGPLKNAEDEYKKMRKLVARARTLASAGDVAQAELLCDEVRIAVAVQASFPLPIALKPAPLSVPDQASDQVLERLIQDEGFRSEHMRALAQHNARRLQPQKQELVARAAAADSVAAPAQNGRAHAGAERGNAEATSGGSAPPKAEKVLRKAVKAATPPADSSQGPILENGHAAPTATHPSEAAVRQHADAVELAVELSSGSAPPAGQAGDVAPRASQPAKATKGEQAAKAPKAVVPTRLKVAEPPPEVLEAVLARTVVPEGAGVEEERAAAEARQRSLEGAAAAAARKQRLADKAAKRRALAEHPAARKTPAAPALAPPQATPSVQQQTAAPARPRAPHVGASGKPLAPPPKVSSVSTRLACKPCICWGTALVMNPILLWPRRLSGSPKAAQVQWHHLRQSTVRPSP